MRIFKILQYLCLFISSYVFSQTSYSTDSTYFQKISPYYFFNDTTFPHYQFIDTSVIHFQNSLPFYFNGQIGTAQPDYLLQNSDESIGSRIWDFFIPDILTEKNLPVYRTKGFYSQLDGIAGSKDEQHFKAYFTSPVKQKHQINFYLRRSTNKGFYQRQQASITNFFTDYHLFGKKRMSMDANLLLNYIKYQENGGITKDTLSYNELSIDKILIPIRLQDARKNIQTHSFQYNIHYLLHKDSIQSHAVSLSFHTQRKIFQYQDNYPLSGYYNFIFLDTIKTNDSLHSIKIDIPLSYTYKHKNIITQLSYQYQWNNIHLFMDTLMENHILKSQTELYFKLSQHSVFNQSIDVNYIFNGTQKNNLYVKLLSTVNYRQIKTELLLKSVYESPTFLENFWYSNHFIWYNHFKNISKQTISVAVRYQNFLSLNYKLLNTKNYIFFIDNYPQQYTNNLVIHQIKLAIDKVFFKHLGLKADYYYQWKSASVIALPEHFLKADVYYQGRWFHKNLLVNTGMQYISTLTAFSIYQYNPSTGIYSISTKDFYSIPYPQIGIYFSGRIKPVNFFIRMDNILSSFYPQAYYYIPHYMMQDRFFRMGISWSFFD